MEAAGYKVAAWVKEMLAGGIKSFYKIEKGEKLAYSPGKKNMFPP